MDKATDNACEKQVSDILFSLGFEPHMLGYYFILDAVQMMATDPVAILKAGLTKYLYPEIGKQHGYTMSKVERAIRHSIDRAFSTGAPGWQEICTKENPPFNGLFISRMAEVIRLKKVS